MSPWREIAPTFPRLTVAAMSSVCGSTCCNGSFKTRWCGQLVSYSWGESRLREVQESPCRVTTPVFENGEIMAKNQVYRKPNRPTVIHYESHDIAELDTKQK